MTWSNLGHGDELPGCYDVARYCFNGTIRKVQGKPHVVARAFEKGRDKKANISLSVMNFFHSRDKEVIWEVCKYRGGLIVCEKGNYLKLKVDRITQQLQEATNRYYPVIFTPFRRNPAHATIYPGDLQISVSLAVLANQEGEILPVPSPIPDPF